MRILSKIKGELAEGRTFLQFGLLNGVGQALGMIAPLIIAKFLSPELFGSYSLAKMIMFFFLTIFIAGIQTSFIVLANQERMSNGKINKSFSIQCLFMVAGLCVFMAVVVSLSRPLASFSGISIGDFVFVCFAFVGFAIECFLANLFMAMGQRIRSAFVELTFGALTVGLVFVFYWAGEINIKSVFLVHFVSSITVVLIFAWGIDFEKLRPFTVDKKHLKDMFDFAKWVILGAAAVYFVNWGDSFVLRVFNKPLGDIGTYNLGYGIFKGICGLILIINSYFLPFASENIDNGTKIHEFLYKKRPRILLLGVVVIGLLFIVSPYFFSVVYQGVYRESSMVLRVLLIGCLLFLYSIFYDPIFHAARRYKFTQTLNIAQAVINLVVDFLLVPSMGLMGTAIGAVCGYFCRAATMEIYFNTRLKKILKM